MAPINYSFPERYRDSYREEIASFVDGILNQNYYNVTEDECVMSHLMAEAAAGSAKSQQVIDFKAYYRDMLAGN